jgi:23S rRNA (uracil1939-C5)-methyltransferase
LRKKKPTVTLENLLFTAYAAEGKSIAHHEGKVIFVSGVIPGDRADVVLVKNKKDWAEGRVLRLVTPSDKRMTPFCRHFGTCGGCKWQHMPYEMQLECKEKEVAENIRRIAGTVPEEFLPILGSDQQRAYRNKLEFTFSTKSYLPYESLGDATVSPDRPALGYHAPRIFDKVIDIQECHLMDEVNNKIRNLIRDYAFANDADFYDIREHKGWLRNIILRYTTTGQLMVNICFGEERKQAREKLLAYLLTSVPEITTLLYTINPKHNDTIYDLVPEVYHGPGHVTERLGHLQFIISPKSFFQTNTLQAEKLYGIVRDFAGLTGKETLYDLYCGTGSIGLFLAEKAGKVIGVEVIAQAVEDAQKNATANGIENAQFFCGDVIKICDNAFFHEHGQPEVVITDPPRAGMHEKLVKKLLEMEANRIVYVSCNSATMARDLALLLEKYDVKKCQPVDMFPHTHHIESVVLLDKKQTLNP